MKVHFTEYVNARNERVTLVRRYFVDRDGESVQADACDSPPLDWFESGIRWETLTEDEARAREGRG